MRPFLLFALSTALLLSQLAYAPPHPTWWATRGVLDASSNPDDHAAVNQGQLKNMARATFDEMQAALPGGAGTALTALIDSWETPTASTDDFFPVNQGQLKALAAPFYQRLEALRASLAPDWPVIHLPWAQPGQPAAGAADPQALANIGQVKNLFAQLDGNRHQHGDLSDPSANPTDYQFGIAWLKDSTGSGTPDYQAIELDTTLLVYDFALVSGGGQTVAPNAVSADPIIVKLLHQNAPAANVAVTLSTGGSAATTGALGTSASGPWETQLTLPTNTQGEVEVWWQAPNQPSQQVSLTVTAPGQTTPLAIPVGTGSGEDPNVPGTPTVLVHPQVVPEWRIKYMGFDMGEIAGEDDAWGYIHNYFGIHDWFWSWTREDYFSHFVSTSSYESPSTYYHPWHNWDLWYSNAQEGWFRAGGFNAIDLGNPNETRFFIGEPAHPQINETTFAAITDSNGEILSWKPLSQPWWTQIRFKVVNSGNYDWKKTWIVCREDAWIDGVLQTGDIPTWAAGFGPAAIGGNTSVAAILTIELQKDSLHPKVEIQYVDQGSFSTSADEIFVTEEGSTLPKAFVLNLEPRISEALTNFQYRSSRFVLLPVEVKTETIADQPANRGRKKIGIGEEVRLDIISPAHAQVTWALKAGSHGELIRPIGYPANAILFTASEQEKKAEVEVTLTNYQNAKSVVTFDVIAPKSITFEKTEGPGIAIDDNPAGIRMEFKADWYYGPDDVCFYNVVGGETEAPAVRTGCFLDDSSTDRAHDPWIAGLGGNLTKTVTSGKGTKCETPDHIRLGRWQPPVIDKTGRFEWNIQWKYRLKWGSGDGTPFAPVTQWMEIISGQGFNGFNGKGGKGNVNVP